MNVSSGTGSPGSSQSLVSCFLTHGVAKAIKPLSFKNQLTLDVDFCKFMHHDPSSPETESKGHWSRSKNECKNVSKMQYLLQHPMRIE